MVPDTAAPKSLVGESFMAGPCKLSESMAQFLTDHVWWVQSQHFGLHSVGGLLSLVLPPLMTQGVPRLSEMAWQGGFTAFAPWPAPGLVLLPLVQMMTPPHYQPPQHLQTSVRETIYSTLMAPRLRQLVRAQPVQVAPPITPMMTKVQLMEVVYVTESSTTRTLVVDAETAFGRRLLRLQERLVWVIREEVELEVMMTALTLHPM